MSLKAFHIFFVVVSTLTALGFGVWALGQPADAGYRVLGILALLVGIALPVYGWWFLKKTKGVSYL